MPLALNLFDELNSWLAGNGSVVISACRTIIDILLVWLLLFYLIEIVRRNIRTLQIFKGVLLVFIIKLLANVLSLNMVSWLVDQILNWGVVALIIVFQPEIRTMLEKLGQTRVISNVTTLSNPEKEKLVNEIYEACRQMSEDHTGALISFEREQSLMDYIASGVQINADVNSDLLLTIFMEGTRLHDGAVIIQGKEIRCASAFFPQTHRELSPKYGARHRAALGVSEVTDALTIVVSEETGTISFAIRGELTPVPASEFKDRLLKEIDAFIEPSANGGDQRG